MSYVRVKHAFSAAALRALEDPRLAGVARALLGFCQTSPGGGEVALADVGRAADLSPSEVRHVLREIGLFVEGGATVALAAPYRPFSAYLCRQARRLASALELARGPAPTGVAVEVWRGVALFNSGLYFECHEYWEDVWRSSREPERTFFHGLVQAAAGCYHLEKGNWHGAHVLMGKAIAKLRAYAPTFLGVDVERLVESLERMRTPAAAPEAIGSPRIDLVEAGSQCAPRPAPGRTE